MPPAELKAPPPPAPEILPFSIFQPPIYPASAWISVKVALPSAVTSHLTPVIFPVKLILPVLSAENPSPTVILFPPKVTPAPVKAVEEIVKGPIVPPFSAWISLT